MRLLAGTSGYSYKEWVGAFYPDKHPAAAMLRYYAERFPTVEINNTFYRMPAEELLEKWGSEVPAGFTFALKAPQRITHIKRLKEVGADVAEFTRRAAVLGDKLGMLLFQLPPFSKKDAGRLRDLLAAVPREQRTALEFRHDSWHDDEVYGILRDGGAALCVVDDDDGTSPFVVTSDEMYLRLRRSKYEEADLRAWIERIAAQPLKRVCVYFKHEDEALAPRFAKTFDDLWRARGTAQPPSLG